MLSRKQPEQMRRQCDVEEWDDSQAQDAAQLFWFAAQLIKEIFQAPKNLTRVLLKDQTGGGKQNAFSTALKKGNPQDSLQVAHLLGHAGLRNPESISRPAKTTGFGHGQEIAQVADLEGVGRHGGRAPSRSPSGDATAQIGRRILLP